MHYFFRDPERVRRLVERGELLEWAEFAGHHYGTPREPVEDRLAEGTPVLLEIELQGARQVRAAMPEALLVFLAPPSWDELVRRLVGPRHRAGRGDRPPAGDRGDRAGRRSRSSTRSSSTTRSRPCAIGW